MFQYSKISLLVEMSYDIYNYIITTSKWVNIGLAYRVNMVNPLEPSLLGIAASPTEPP